MTETREIVGQQLDRLLAALEESNVDDAISQIVFDAKHDQEIVNEIKRLESWPPNSWPSMNDRTIYSALLHRAKDAEERLQQLEQEKARLEVSVDDLRSALDCESALRRDAETALDEANERACE